MINREAIAVAFFNLLAGIPGIVTASRRLKHWTEVDARNQPALFVAQTDSQAKKVTNLPTQWKLNYEVYLYANTGGDLTKVPASTLNPIVDDICEAIDPANGTYQQVLGGLVHACKIEGTVLTDEGVLGDQGVVILPVTIYAND